MKSYSSGEAGTLIVTAMRNDLVDAVEVPKMACSWNGKR